MLREEYLVTKSNLLTEIRASTMTIQELRFLSIYISRINPFDENSKYVKFTLQEFQRIMSLGIINKKHIENVFERLLCKVIKIPIETGRRRGFSMVTLFSKCQCIFDEETEETVIIINVHDDILPLLFDLKSNFLNYRLWNCLRLKSINQLRMYEISKQYEIARIRTLSIADLKDMLGIEKDEYPVYSVFRRDVLDVCKKSLSENTDICFEYDPIKKGRKFVSIKFTIYNNKDFIDPLGLEEFIGAQLGYVDDERD